MVGIIFFNLKFGTASALLVRDSDLGFGIEQINFDQRPGKLCGWCLMLQEVHHRATVGINSSRETGSIWESAFKSIEASRWSIRSSFSLLCCSSWRYRQMPFVLHHQELVWWWILFAWHSKALRNHLICVWAFLAVRCFEVSFYQRVTSLIDSLWYQLLQVFQFIRCNLICHFFNNCRRNRRWWCLWISSEMHWIWKTWFCRGQYWSRQDMRSWFR